MIVLSIIQLTFRESLAKKTFIAFFSISTFIALLLLFALNLDVVDGFQSTISVFGKESSSTIDLREIIWGVEGGLAVFLFTGGLFMALFATSNLFTNLMQPGFVDLFVSKPVSRLGVISARFGGAVAIVAFNIFYLVIATWLILSIKTGLWNWGYLLSGILIVVTFAVLYSLVTLLSVLTGSSAFSLMITYLILFFSPLLLQRDRIYALLSSRIYGIIVDGLYYILPKTSELGNITQKVVRGAEVASWMPLWSSMLFGLAVFGLAALVFCRKNL